MSLKTAFYLFDLVIRRLFVFITKLIPYNIVMKQPALVRSPKENLILTNLMNTLK